MSARTPEADNRLGDVEHLRTLPPATLGNLYLRTKRSHTELAEYLKAMNTVMDEQKIRIK